MPLFRWRKIPVSNGLQQTIDDVNEQMPKLVATVGWQVVPTLVATSDLAVAAVRTFARVDPTAGAVTVTLGSGERDGQEVRVRRVAGGANAVTVNGGSASVLLPNDGDTTTLVWTGSDWIEA